jgi:RecJ-like exonuclease
MTTTIPDDIRKVAYDLARDSGWSFNEDFKRICAALLTERTRAETAERELKAAREEVEQLKAMRKVAAYQGLSSSGRWCNLPEDWGPEENVKGFEYRPLYALDINQEYITCEDCGGSGLMTNMAGEPDECSACKGNTVVYRARSIIRPTDEGEVK